MKHRKLRMAWSVAWGIVAVLLVALWVRSLSYSDSASAPLPGGRGFIVESVGSRTDIQLYYALRLPWHTQTYSLKEIGTVFSPEPLEGLGFDFYPRETYCGLTLPYWFNVLLTFGVTVCPWIRLEWFRRFSVRTLLIATTLVAVGLGLIVWLR